MRLTLDEYCKHFKMSKEMVNSKLRTKKLNYTIENDITYIITNEQTIAPNKPEQISQEKISSAIVKPKITVATVLALYKRENTALKEKVLQLEMKIDKLIDDKEQMLRDERDKIEQVYTTKDTHLKNILELVNNKMILERQETTIHELESFNHENKEEDITGEEVIELKEYLKSLQIKPSQRKVIKKRFLDVYDSDIRILRQDGKLYLNFSKYDYSDLLA